MTEEFQIIGPSLKLRFATPADAQHLFQLGASEEVTRFFSWGPYTSLEQPKAYIESLAAKRESGDLLEFLVVHRNHGPIGVTGICEIARRDRRATVGTWFGRQWWGTGANFESKALIAAFAFDHLGLERLTAWANTTNGRSQAALERVGFQKEGVLRKWHRHGDVMHDVVAFSLLRSEWEGSPMQAIPVKISGAVPAAFVLPV